MAEQQTSSGSNENTRLSVAQLLEALDTQIKYETASQRNDGWTRWAIWGALAALIWVGSDLWQQIEMGLGRVVLLTLLVFVMRRILEESVWMLLPVSRLEVGAVRFRRAADEVSPRRPEIIYDGLQHLAVIGVLMRFKIPDQWILWPYAVSGVAIAGIRLMVGSLATGFPSRMSLWAAIHSVTVAHVIILAVAGWQLIGLIRADSTPLTLSDVRLALVLNAGLFLVSRLVGMISSEHLLSKLTQLRQHIAFGRLSLEDANSKTEEILSGITLAELFAPLVQAVEQEIKTRLAAIAETDQKLNSLNDKLASQSAQPFELLRALDGMGSPPSAVVRNTKQLRRAWRRLGSNALSCAFYSPDCRTELNAMTDAVRNQLQGVDEKMRECFARYYAMKAELRQQSAQDVG